MSNEHNEAWLEMQTDLYREARHVHNYKLCSKIIKRIMNTGYSVGGDLASDMIKHRSKWWAKQGLCPYCGLPLTYVGKKIAECDCQK